MIPGSEGSDFREIIFVPPTASPESNSRGRENQASRPEQTFDNPNNFPTTQETTSRRRLRLNIDPRRRTQPTRVDTPSKSNTSNRARHSPVEKTTSTNRKELPVDINKQLRNRKGPKQSSFDLFERNQPGKLFEAFPEDENTVTINIGGTPIVIPDFDLSPRTHEKSVSLTNTQNRNISPNTPKPTRKAPNTQTQRRNRNQQNPNNQRSQGQRNRQAAKRKNSSSRTTTPKTTTQRATTLNTFSTTLTSFNTLLQSRESFRSFDNFPQAQAPQTTISKAPGRTFNRRPKPKPQVKRVNQQAPTASTTLRTTKITPRRRNQPSVTRKPSQSRRNKAPKRPSPETQISSSPDRQSEGTELCPGSLEDCVDSCVPLDDVYAYSACVVECGGRC